MTKKKPEVVIVMGSQSDLNVMAQACAILDEYGVPYEINIVSAHRTPDLLKKSVRHWEKTGVKIIIAGAGGAAHLPGMLASYSVKPVIGVPVKGKAMNGLDSLLSIAQMPKGVPVATVAVDNSSNAALLALSILGSEETRKGREISRKLKAYKRSMVKQVGLSRTKLSKMGLNAFLESLS